MAKLWSNKLSMKVRVSMWMATQNKLQSWESLKKKKKKKNSAKGRRFKISGIQIEDHEKNG